MSFPRFSFARAWPALVFTLLPAAAQAAEESQAADDAQRALARCVAIAGAPDAGAPVSRAAMGVYLDALARARPYCETAARADPPPPPALFNLASAQQRAGDHARAVDNFEAAAAAGLAAARSKLGDYYNFGIGPVEEDHARAVAEYRAAAKAGDLPAMATLALMHRFARGVPQDHARMLELLKQAADGGYHFAQLRLAELYLDPKGIGRDDAAALGLPDPSLAVEYYARAAGQGSVTAMLKLAALYADDADGIPADAARYARWVERAAQTGAPRAKAALGVLLEQGRGMARDPERAARLYVEALQSGDVPFGKLRQVGGARAPSWDRATAIAFQQILRERGHYRGAIDGIVGPGTAAAARALVGG
jgi:TPR repeat protein